MFFFIALTNRQEDLGIQWLECSHCQKKERAHIYLTYQVLILFFIPVFKWNKRYLVKMEDCGSLYEVEDASLEKLHLLKSGDRKKYCPYCLAEIDASYQYCPHCGKEVKERM